MATSDNCYTPLEGFLIRVIALDDCGAPVSGAASTVIMEDFITVRFAPDYEAGKEFISENARGNFIVNRKMADRMKRLGVEMALGLIDPAMLAVMLGNSLENGSNEPIGVSFDEERNTTKFSLEVWGGTAEEKCVGDDPLFEYMVVPWMDNAHFGETTVGNELTNLTIMATSHRSPGFTGYSDAPALPREFGPKEHMQRFLTTEPPPDPAEAGVFCGFQPSTPSLV